jgi:peptide/nickel transport system substrate-binding protein
MKRKIKFIIYFVLSSALISCNYSCNNDEIIQEIDFFPSGLDPAKDIGYSEYQILSQIYEPLLTLKNDYKTLIPCLANNWSLSEDNITYTFQLLSDVNFHDGSKLTAEAVRISFMYQVKERQNYLPYAIIDTILSLTPQTLQIKLKHPFEPFLYFLASPTGLLVISKTALEKYGQRIDKNPVGTGPFYLNEWLENDFITLNAYSNYRETSKVKRIKFIPYKNANKSYELLSLGKLDIMYMVDANWLDRFQWTGKIEFYVKEPLNTHYIGFNLLNYPVNINEVRKAILSAIDIKNTVLKGNRGNAIPAINPLPPIYRGFDDIKQSDFNPQRSREYLTEAGFGSGLKLNLYVWSPAYSRQMKVELIESQLEKVGIFLKPLFFHDPEAFNEAIKTNECHLFLGGYGIDYLGDPWDLLYALFHSNSNYNQLNYKNSEFDNLLDTAIKEMNNEKQHELYRSIIKLILEDTPAIFDSHVKSHFAYNINKIKSLRVNPYDYIYFHRLETYE